MPPHKAWPQTIFVLIVTALFLGLIGPGQAMANDGSLAGGQNSVPLSRPPGQTNPVDKIEPLLLGELSAAGQTDVIVWLKGKADLSPARQLETKAEKGRFVYDTLRATAKRQQQTLRRELDRQGISYRPFYIANKILVRGGSQSLVLNLASRADVARITANHTHQFEPPTINRVAAPQVQAIEPNLSFVQADQVWAMGIDGRGVVLAGNDTGLDWDHPALIDQYRGWNGTAADHNYNWWDATGSYPTVPGDGYGHGTHTTGTMVGSEGNTNQIGIAPGSQTIHCKNLDDDGHGTDASIIECFEWDLAPWDLNGANPRPDLAPDAINNSWGYSGGSQLAFQDEINALQAAGIVVEVSAGNDGPGCSSLGSPGDYGQLLTVGAVDHAGSTFPGTLSYFSSRGPSALDPAAMVPDVVAPGENIRSSVPGGLYQAGWSGTSMSGPHVTGLVGLIWSANPALRGQVAKTIEIITETAAPLAGQPGTNCGGDYILGPNNDWGYGTIDALAAVQQALVFGDTGTLAGVVTDAVSQTPISEVVVRATLSPTLTWRTRSDSAGRYTLRTLSGLHAVEASKYGYLPAQLSNISVMSRTTTTLDISLTPAATHLVSGAVADAQTGWPVRARIDIDEYPGSPIWNDPVTGYYSVTLAAGLSYNFSITAIDGGYQPLSRRVGPLAGDQVENFGLSVDVVACSAPGYIPSYSYLEDFESGYNNWTMTGLWNPENEGDTCGGQVTPFSSPGNAVYYGLDTWCTYDDWSVMTGTLTMAAPVTLPTLDGAVLSVASYEETECGGDCYYDNRYIELSNDGGTTWNTLGEGDTEGVWYQNRFDLASYLGQTIRVRFRFDPVDTLYNGYFGWLVDDVAIQTDCAPVVGGHVRGYVYDANSGQPLAGTVVTSDSGHSATTDDNGFYSLFETPGTHVITATRGQGYEPISQSATVFQDGIIRQDFYLPVGRLKYDQPALEITLRATEQKTVSLNLVNDGSVATAFNLAEIDMGSNIGAHGPAGDTLHRTGQVYTHLEEKETEPQSVARAPDVRHNNRPDPFGYTVYDSTDVAGPVYDWIEIAPPAGGSGTELVALTGIDDGYFWPLSLPFPFDFYGIEYSEVAIGSNGTIYFENSYQDYLNHPIPNLNSYGVNTFIAPLWDDLVITPGSVYYQLIGPMLIIEYYQVSHYSYYEAYGHSTWQVILFENGNILFQYQDMTFDDSSYNQGQSATVGIQGDGLTGLQYSYNTPTLTDTLAICFAFPGRSTACPSDVSWLSTLPASGTLAPATGQTLQLTVDTGLPAVMQPGQYYARLRVTDDSPYILPPVPVTMTVQSAYSLSLTPAADAKFGDSGSTVRYALQIANTGLLTDTFELMVTGNIWPLMVPLGASTAVSKLVIGPLGPGQHETLPVMVTIPINAGLSAFDTATITVTSQADSNKSSTTTLRTTVGDTPIQHLFLPVIVR